MTIGIQTWNRQCFITILFTQYLVLVLCARDGRFSEWGDWKSCSVSCGSGEQIRYRTCEPPQGNGKWCEGSYRETKECETGVLCQIDGGWNEWGSWTVCSVTCGEGTMHRYRSCNRPLPQAGGKQCQGQVQESQPCFALKECPRDGKWSSWSKWSACSVTCGSGGSIHRYRSCNNPPPAADGRPCDGLPHSERPCRAPKACPVNGQWSEWSEWTECSVTCGKGEQRRWRRCDEPPPQFGGEDCNRTDGGEMQLRTCNGTLVLCPVDGGWSDWSDWGSCNSPDCQSRTQTSYVMRERICNSPSPANNGTMCQGSFLDAGICLQPTNCKVHGGWSEWTGWACLPHVVRRQRHCDNPPPSSGGNACKGSKIEFFGREAEEFSELCPDFVTDDEDFQNGSGSGMQMDEVDIDPRHLN